MIIITILGVQEPTLLFCENLTFVTTLSLTRETHI